MAQFPAERLREIVGGTGRMRADLRAARPGLQLPGALRKGNARCATQAASL